MQDIIARLPPVVLLVSFLIFWGWEALVSARPRSGDSPRRCRNLALSALAFAAAGGAGALLVVLPTVAGTAHWGLSAVGLPLWTVTATGVLLLDVTDQRRHRISYAVPWLWRLHRLHHSDPRIDVTTSLRSHPVELALRPAFLAVAVLVFGIPLLPVLIYPVLQLPVLVFQHANIRLGSTWDRAFGWLIPTPALHLVHHSRLAAQTDSNYGTFLMIWDRLFGSYHAALTPAALGLDGLDDERSQTLLGMLAQPWERPARLSQT